MRASSLTVATLIIFMLMFQAHALDSFDVLPTEHWIYDALFVLQDRGIIGEYSEGMYDPDRLLTRYEAALITARYLTNDNRIEPARVMSTLNPEHRLLMNRIVHEYAYELNLLGICTSRLLMTSDTQKTQETTDAPDKPTATEISTHRKARPIVIAESQSHHRPGPATAETVTEPALPSAEAFSTPPLPVPTEGPLGDDIDLERDRVRRRIARRQQLEERDLTLKRLAPKISANHIWSRTILQGININPQTDSPINEFSPTPYPGFGALEELRFVRNRHLTHGSHLSTDFTLRLARHREQFGQAFQLSGRADFENRLWHISLGQLNTGKTSFEHFGLSNAARVIAPRRKWVFGADFGQHWGGIDNSRFNRPALGFDASRSYDDVWLGGLLLGRGQVGIRYNSWQDNAGGLIEADVPGRKSSAVMLAGFADMRIRPSLNLRLETALQKTEDSRDIRLSDEARANDARLTWNQELFRLSWHYRNMHRDFERFASVETPARSSNFQLALYPNRRILMEASHRRRNIVTRDTPEYSVVNPGMRITFYPLSRLESFRCVAELESSHRQSLNDDTFDRLQVKRKISLVNSMYQNHFTWWGGTEHLRDRVDEQLSTVRWLYGMSAYRDIGKSLRFNFSWDRDIQQDRTRDMNWQTALNFALPMDTDIRVAISSSDQNKPDPGDDLNTHTYAVTLNRLIYEGREFMFNMDNTRKRYANDQLSAKITTIGAEYVVRF